MGIKKPKIANHYHPNGQKLTADKVDSFMYGNNKRYLITQYGGPLRASISRISEEEWESMKSILVIIMDG